MWPFKRRKAQRGTPQEGSWSIAQGEHAGAPLFARVRADPGSDIRSHHGYRIGVAVPLLNPLPTGLPQGKEFNELSAIEDLLADSFEAQQRSVHVLSITTGGMREFVFYTSEPRWVQTAIEALAVRVAPHELQHYVEHDPEWELYRQFMRGGDAA